ncbi:hypothetical protein S1OALGB6SA_437 [Olavius algarvensis spirochete endosymbiont]|uniref:hypothetical protein n=1 Tax=Olavius algarvensis spirochete endosymbiont TaxID=260710 RepID=UPI000F224013|nr:hypothetical protein [Olavius algarvensis spirochete endosymbiont]VDA99369.1 hypothetical protein S1OALGB6SA_437 [Olavius algarvensis spirochete endosymbiont]
MSTWEWIEKELSPPGIRKAGRRGLYRIIGRIAQQAADDMAQSKRGFFAYLARNLDAHGSSKGIPRFPFDTDESYRRRLTSAAEALSSTGKLGGLKSFLDSYIPGRWRLMDSPKNFFRVGFGQVGITPIGIPPMVIVYVADLTTDEQSDIEAFLDWFLGADIEYRVLLGGASLPSAPLSYEDLGNNGGAAWLNWHLIQVAPVIVSLLPYGAFAIESGKGVGRGRIYRGSGVYVVVCCSAGSRKAIEDRLKLLIESSIEVIFEEKEL